MKPGVGPICKNRVQLRLHPGRNPCSNRVLSDSNGIFKQGLTSLRKEAEEQKSCLEGQLYSAGIAE